MQIADSAIQLSSQHTEVERFHKKESLTIRQNREEPNTVQIAPGRGGGRKSALSLQHRDRVSIAHPGDIRRRHIEPSKAELTDEQKETADLNIRLLKALFEKITGRKFHIAEPFSPEQGEGANVQEVPEVQVKAEAPPTEDPMAGFSLVYDYHESRYEHERTDFQAEGLINTGDGRQIEINLNLSMSREFYSENNFQIRMGEALKDPLVINYSGTAAQVTERNFSFDIDADGHKDQIAFVRPGSGFLALDKNDDGEINDGSELFGALSGDGFADLIQYDSDGNNWIDENDAIYESLRIWSKNPEGDEQLVALGKQGVGAIYLGHIETLFSLKDEENALLGQVRETGLALMETGRAVTVQQLDLVA